MRSFHTGCKADGRMSEFSIDLPDCSTKHELEQNLRHGREGHLFFLYMYYVPEHFVYRLYLVYAFFVVCLHCLRVLERGQIACVNRTQDRRITVVFICPLCRT